MPVVLSALLAVAVAAGAGRSPCEPCRASGTSGP
jgi:hypothetical protein